MPISPGRDGVQAEGVSDQLQGWEVGRVDGMFKAVQRWCAEAQAPAPAAQVRWSLMPIQHGDAQMQPAALHASSDNTPADRSTVQDADTAANSGADVCTEPEADAVADASSDTFPNKARLQALVLEQVVTLFSKVRTWEDFTRKKSFGDGIRWWKALRGGHD